MVGPEVATELVLEKHLDNLGGPRKSGHLLVAPSLGLRTSKTAASPTNAPSTDSFNGDPRTEEPEGASYGREGSRMSALVAIDQNWLTCSERQLSAHNTTDKPCCTNSNALFSFAVRFFGKTQTFQLKRCNTRFHTTR